MAQPNSPTADAFPEAINLTVKQGIKEIGVFELDPRIFTVRELKMIIEDASNVQEIHQRLVYGGKVLQDESLLTDFLKPRNGEATIFMSRINAKNEEPKRPASAPTASNSPSERFKAMSPIASMMSKNPELLEQMFLANPQFQKMAEKNPQIKHALSDPSTLKTMFDMSTNPKVYKEVMRGHDRALSNLENIPQGFQHLVRIQKSLDNVDRRQSERQVKTQIDASDSGTKNRLTSEPFPNPWVKSDAKTVRSKFLQDLGRTPHPNLDLMMEEALVLDDNRNSEEPNWWDAKQRTLEESTQKADCDPQTASEYEDAMEMPSAEGEDKLFFEKGLTYELPFATPLKSVDLNDPLLKKIFAGTEIEDNLEQYEAMYSSELVEMEKMGCDDKIMNLRVLAYTDGDLDRAIEWVLTGNLRKKDDEINQRRHG